MDENIKEIITENIGIYQQLEKLEHINIIKVLSCKEKDGYYIVEEEVFESRTMSEVLQEEEVAGDVFYDWILQICDALEYLYEANPPIADISLQPVDILIGEDNVLKLIGFSNAVNTLKKVENQAQGIDGIIALMKNVNGKYMKKYASLIEDWESNEELMTIGDFRNKIIEAYTSRFGIKQTFWVGMILIILLLSRLARRLF